MFRFSLKKEEKEMIVRTINEIQELRAELSLLKNTLAGMTPGAQDRDTAGAVAPAGGEEAPGPACAGDFPDGASAGPGELYESGLAPEDSVSYREAGLPDPEDPGVEESPVEDIQNTVRGAVPEKGPAEDRAGENPGKDNPAVPEAQGGSAAQAEAGAGRDWAVVRLIERKRPWWKIWDPGKRETRRSI